MNDFEFMIPIVAIVFSIGFAMLAVVVGARTKQKRWEALASVQNRMLDKFGSAQEFTEFLRTPEGRSYMLVAADKSDNGQPGKILSSIKWGVVLSMLGLGFLVIAATVEDGAVWPGVLTLSLGLGFLASSFISIRLARSWGMFNRAASDEGESIS